jgi:hypothetical protein
MEPTYTFEEDGRLLRLTYADTPTLEEWSAAMMAIMADPGCHPGLCVLMDRTSAGPPTTEFLRGLAAFVDEHRDVVRGWSVAMVVADTASYGMARMGQALLARAGVSFEIFQTPADAEGWLRQRCELARHA